MEDSDRYRLMFGPYTTPDFAYGDVVVCARRGEVEIVGLSSGPIPWPVGKVGRHRFLILYAGLAEAVRREPGRAVGLNSTLPIGCVSVSTMWATRRSSRLVPSNVFADGFFACHSVITL